jgi:hypothetical protein
MPMIPFLERFPEWEHEKPGPLRSHRGRTFPRGNMGSWNYTATSRAVTADG